MIYKFGDWVRAIMDDCFKNCIGIVIERYGDIEDPYAYNVFFDDELGESNGDGATMQPSDIEPVCWQCRWGVRNEFNDEHQRWCMMSFEHCTYNYHKEVLMEEWPK